ncbi:Uncharacterised protein [uncultured archaeon]|nr:Uncharacterised protein [uncultured archaeon]
MNSKIFSFFILIIFLISFCSAVDFGISPGTIKISEKINEVVCKNFTLIGEGNNIFNGEIKWSNENSRNILDYKISSDKLKINIEIPSGIKAGTYQICISAEKGGDYYGALMYKLNNSSYGIGTWIELNAESGNFFSMTGSAINNFDYGKIFLFSPILLLIILFLLLRKLKRKKTEFTK